jgi:hypothetical protein
MPVLNLVGCGIRIVEGSGITEIMLTPESLDGEVEEIDIESRALLVSGTWVHVMPMATGMDITGEDYSLTPLMDVVTGNSVTCFGFRAGGGEFACHAFAFLVGEDG